MRIWALVPARARAYTHRREEREREKGRVNCSGCAIMITNQYEGLEVESKPAAELRQYRWQGSFEGISEIP